MNFDQVYALFCDILKKNNLSDMELDDMRWVDCGYSFLGGQIYDRLEEIDGVDSVKVGSSKLVVLLDGVNDFVVKIPLYGEAPYDEEYGNFLIDDEETNLWERDYCAKEAKTYNDFFCLGKHLESMLAETRFCGLYGCVPIYVSERVKPTCYSLLANDKSISNDSRKKASDYCVSTKNNELCPVLMAAFIQQYGYEMARGLDRALQDYAVNDVHPGNCGIDAHGRLKILDYSGFNY